MAEILKHLQDHYVPIKSTDSNGKTEKEVLDTIPFGGDQLTEERAINVQKGFLDGENKYEKLQGLSPKFEDWHAKKTLYEVSDFSP